MAIVISYNGQEPWNWQGGLGGYTATPYFSMDKEPVMQHGKIAELKLITLSGQIGNFDPTIPAENNQMLEDARLRILTTFSDSFKELLVYEIGTGAGGTNTVIYSHPNVMVDSVDFPEQKMIGIMDYTITLKCYEDSYFDNAGIVEKNDSFSIGKDPSDIVTLTHRIYARGINTGTNCVGGLTAARAFVQGRAGLGNIGNTFIGAGFVGGQGGPMLIDTTENINRLEGTYEIIETWRADPSDENSFPATAGRVVMRHVVDVSESTFDSDFQDVNVTYTLTGGYNTTVAEMRSAAKTITYQGQNNHMHTAAIARGLTHHPSAGLGGLEFQWESHEPLEISYEEDMASKTIIKSARFTNDPRWIKSYPSGFPVWYDAEVSIDTDELTLITNVSVSATIGSIGPQPRQAIAINEFLINCVGPAASPNHVINLGGDAEYHLQSPSLVANTPPAGVLASLGILQATAGEHYLAYKSANNEPIWGSIVGWDDWDFNNGYETDHSVVSANTSSQFKYPNLLSPTNMQISRDNERPGARVSVSFSDKDMIVNYESASYNVSVTKPIVHRKSTPSANIDGHYALTNFLQNDGPNVDPNLPPNLRPMYTRQKHNARVNLGHQVTPAGSDEQHEFATRTRARLWVTQLDELYLGAGAFLSTADGRAGYRVSDSETHGWNLTQTVSKTRSVNYATNLPLINLPPDPPLDSCLTNLDAIALQAATSFTVSDATCFANFTFNPVIVISPGTIEEETFMITSVSGNTININGALANTHAVSIAVIAPGSGIGDP